MQFTSVGNICLRSLKLGPFSESDKDLRTKHSENMVGGLSEVLTREAVNDKNHYRRSANFCIPIVRIGASQLYPYSMFQSIPTGPHNKYVSDSDLPRFKSLQNISGSLTNTVTACRLLIRPHCRNENFYTTGTQKKIAGFNADGFCGHCNTVSEAMSCIYQYCPCQEARPAPTERDIHR